MRWILLIIPLLFLAACGECSDASDCPSKLPGFEAACIDSECKYTAVPNVCGNNECEAGENECTCPKDCGPCAGKVAGSTYLTKQCINNACMADITGQQEQQFDSGVARGASGDQFRVETTYVSPLNTKRNTVDVTLTLATQGEAQNRLIKSIEVSGRTKDRATITIARKEVDKYLWSEGSSFTENLIVSVPGPMEASLDNIEVVTNYDYNLRGQQRSASFKQRLKTPLTYVTPDVQYPCPESCDDGNPGTQDVCGPETSFFCEHRPISGACGNFVCEGNENKCTCPQDCGPCEGSAGEYVNFVCKASSCSTVLKPGITPEPKSIFDERRVGPIELHNNYEYNIPFSISADKFAIKFDIYEMGDASDFTIETIRLLSGNQKLAEQDVNQGITGEATVEVSIPSITQPEEEHSISLGVWYKYTKDGNEVRNRFNKALGKVTLIQ